MAIRVEIEGRGMVAEFPDGTSPDVIRSSVRRKFFPSVAESATQRLADRGLTPEMVKGGQTSAPGEMVPSTLKEQANSLYSNAVVGFPAAIAGGAALVGDFVKGMPRQIMSDLGEIAGKPRDAEAYAPDLSLTEGVDSLRRSAGKGMSEMGRMGNRPGAITDVSSEIGNIAGNVAALKAPALKDEALTQAANVTAPLRKSLSEETAPRVMRNLIKPRNQARQFGADPGEFTVGMKTTGNDISTLVPQAEAKLTKLERSADQIAFNTREGRTNLIPYAEKVKQAFIRHIDDAEFDDKTELANHLREVMGNELRELGKRTGGSGSAPARVGRAYQQALGSRIGKFTQDPVDGTLRAARQDAWSAINEATSEAVPQLKGINRQIHSGIKTIEEIENSALTAGKADPLSFSGFVAEKTMGPNARSRVAAGLRKLSPVEEPTPQGILPNESSQFNPLTAAAKRGPRLLGPAPEGGGSPKLPDEIRRQLSPEDLNRYYESRKPRSGFISSDDMRRVGTRVGQTPDQDAAVFAPQNRTGGMDRPPTTGAMPPDTPDWIRQILDREKSPLLDTLMRQDMRGVSRNIGLNGAERSLAARGGDVPSAINSTMPDWLYRLLTNRAMGVQ